MEKLEKVIKGLECCILHDPDDKQRCFECPYEGNCVNRLKQDALSLLKAQELPPVKPEKLEERTKKWLDQMTAEERLEEIAAILVDWDGYRTAKGLAGLINEVWAYARYPVKEQEPKKLRCIRRLTKVMKGICPVCEMEIESVIHGRITKFCKFCGQAVEWE